MISPLGNFPMRCLGHSDAQGWLRSQVNWTLDEHLQKFARATFFSHCCGVFNTYKPVACRLVLVLCLCEGLDPESYTLRLRGAGTKCWSVLCCAVLICAVLCCAVLCCAALNHTMLHYCAVRLCCVVLYCAVLHGAVLYFGGGGGGGGGGGYCVFRVNCVAVTSLVLTCV